MFHSIITNKKDSNKTTITAQISFPPIVFIGFKGGGVLGTANAGFLNVTEKFNFLSDLRYVAGTSAGAITALAIALGYNSKEMYEKLYNLPVLNFLEDAKYYATQKSILAKAKRLYRIYTNKSHALSSGEIFLKWLEELVEGKFPENKNLTFGELAEEVEKDFLNNYERNLRFPTMIATNISLYRPEAKTLNAEYTAPLGIAKAARASGSYPTVFEHVKLFKDIDPNDNDDYTDGGLKRNFPTRIYDKDDLLNGYPPTHNLTNPCYLLVEVSSRKSYLQTMHGVKKRIVNRNTLTDFSSTIFNAAIDNIDVEEMRNERLVLVLPDGDQDGSINSLEFTITDKGKIKLINGAEKATLEFLENYAGAAYDVKSYASIEAWLDDVKTQDMLSNIIADYNALYCIEPTEALKHYIEFLQDYALYRKERDELNETIRKLAYKLRKPVNVVSEEYKDQLYKKCKHPKPVFPKEHYDLPFIYPKDSWHALVIADMRMRLQSIKEQIALAEENLALLDKSIKALNGYDYAFGLMSDTARDPRKIYLKYTNEGLQYEVIGLDGSLKTNTIRWNKLLSIDFPKDPADIIQSKDKFLSTILNYTSKAGHTPLGIKQTDIIHHEHHEKVKQYVEQREYLNILLEGKWDLENKLGVNERTFIPNPHYAFFSELLENLQEKELNIDNLIPDTALKSVLHYVDMHSPLLNFPSENIQAPTKFFQIDLRNSLDLKLYLLASIYYLQHKKDKRINEMENIFFKLFKEAVPQNYFALSAFLHQSGLELQHAALKIEKLIHYFDCTQQKAQSVLSIGEENTDAINFTSTINLDSIFANFFLHADEPMTGNKPSIELKPFYKDSETLPLMFNRNAWQIGEKLNSDQAAENTQHTTYFFR